MNSLRPKWTPEEDRILLDLRRKGALFKDISKVVGRHAAGCSRRHQVLSGEDPYVREDQDALGRKETVKDPSALLLELLWEHHSDMIQRAREHDDGMLR